MRKLAESEESRQPSDFSRARRQFYRTLLQIGGNRELQRLFLAIGVHVIYSQYQSYQLQQIRLADYRSIFETVCANDISAAAAAGRAHVNHELGFINTADAGGSSNQQTLKPDTMTRYVGSHPVRYSYKKYRTMKGHFSRGSPTPTRS